MKRNELSSLTMSVVENAIVLANNQDRLKTDKKQTREMADSIIGHFVDSNSLDELPIFLSDMFESMDRENLFGFPGVKVGNSKTELRTMNKQRAARFFHRAYDSLDLPDTLKYYSPFKFVEREIEISLSDEDKLKERCEDLGMDIAAINCCITALQDSHRRAVQRRIESDKIVTQRIAAREKQAAADLKAARLKSISHLSADELAELIQVAEREKVSQAE